jgi:hypothetical protein
MTKNMLNFSQFFIKKQKNIIFDSFDWFIVRFLFGHWKQKYYFSWKFQMQKKYIENGKVFYLWQFFPFIWTLDKLILLFLHWMSKFESILCACFIMLRDWDWYSFCVTSTLDWHVWYHVGAGVYSDR